MARTHLVAVVFVVGLMGVVDGAMPLAGRTCADDHGAARLTQVTRVGRRIERGSEVRSHPDARQSQALDLSSHFLAWSPHRQVHIDGNLRRFSSDGRADRAHRTALRQHPLRRSAIGIHPSFQDLQCGSQVLPLRGQRAESRFRAVGRGRRGCRESRLGTRCNTPTGFSRQRRRFHSLGQQPIRQQGGVLARPGQFRDGRTILPRR